MIRAKAVLPNELSESYEESYFVLDRQQMIFPKQNTPGRDHHAAKLTTECELCDQMLRQRSP